MEVNKSANINSTNLKSILLGDGSLAPTIQDLAQISDDLIQSSASSHNTTSLKLTKIDSLTGKADSARDLGTISLSQVTSVDDTLNIKHSVVTPTTHASLNSKFDITAPGDVKYGRRSGFGGGTDPEPREVFFERIKPETDTGKGQVWVVIHGWTGDKTSFTDLANIVKAARPGDTVLTLDWTSIGGTQFKDALGLILRDNTDAATWIHAVAEFAADKLKRWGVKAESLNLIGQSLGAFVCSEIASFFTTQKNQGVNQIIALDPASDINTGLLGYDLDQKKPGVQEPKRFDEVSRFSRVFQGMRSAAGNEEIASWADESILMDFGSIYDAGQEHGWVVETFKNLINPNQPKLVNNIFSLDDQGIHTELKKDIFEKGFTDPNGHFEGVIAVNRPDRGNSKPYAEFFVGIEKDSSPNNYVFYGTTGDDVLDLKQDFPYLPNPSSTAIKVTFYGGKGNDTFGSNNTLSDTGTIDDELHGGEGDDQLYGMSGDDKLYGDANNDKLYGGRRNDELYGVSAEIRANWDTL